MRGRVTALWPARLIGIAYTIAGLVAYKVSSSNFFMMIFVVPGILIYRRAFEDGLLGSAAAIAVMLSIVVFAAAWLVNRIADRRSP